MLKPVRRLMLLTLTLVLIQFSSMYAQAIAVPISGFSIENHPINPNELYNFQFQNNIEFSIQSNISVNLSISFLPEMSRRQTKIRVNSSRDLGLQFTFRPNIRNFLPKEITLPTLPNVTIVDSYLSTARIYSNDSVAELLFQIEKNAFYGLNPSKNYSFAVYSENNDLWNLINTVEDNGTLQGKLENLQADEYYYLTLYEFQPVSPAIWILFTIIIVICVVAIAFVLSRPEYIHLLKARISSVQRGAHEMSLEDVLENKNRNLILDLILAEPGIHFNEILRRTNVAPGNLVWHLDVLETYRIIGKKRIDNRMVYFPYYNENPFSNLDIKIKRSKLTLEIIRAIEDEPGIWANEIERRLETNRKTIQYHINKLADLGVIKITKTGRQNRIFINSESEYYKNQENHDENKE